MVAVGLIVRRLGSSFHSLGSPAVNWCWTHALSEQQDETHVSNSGGVKSVDTNQLHHDRFHVKHFVLGQKS